MVEVNGRTVGQCFDSLVERFHGIKQGLFDNNGKLHSYIGVYVNWESAYPEELTKPVKDGDEIQIAVMFGGG